MELHLVPVDVVQSVEQHLHHLLDLRQGELDVGIAQEAGQVVLTEVKHQVDAAFVAVVQRRYGNASQGRKGAVTKLRRHGSFQRLGWGPTFGSADLYQVDHVLVLEQLQDLNFPQSRDWELKRWKPELNLFTKCI